MDEDDLFDLEIEGSFTPETPTAQAASPQRPSEGGEARSSDQLGEFKVPSASGEKQIPKRRQPLEDSNERSEQIRVGKVTVGSLPIKIPMSASFANRRDECDSPDDPAVFVPPHELSQRDASLLEQGSVPEAGFRTSLLRQRNKIFQQTGFLPDASGFVINRVSTGITTESLNGSMGSGSGSYGGALSMSASLNGDSSRRGALALALTPVPEQVSMGGR